MLKFVYHVVRQLVLVVVSRVWYWSLHRWVEGLLEMFHWILSIDDLSIELMEMFESVNSVCLARWMEQGQI